MSEDEVINNYLKSPEYKAEFDKCLEKAYHNGYCRGVFFMIAGWVIGQIIFR